MELHQLRYFVAVADLGNFTRAAEQCFVAQPSLSQQIIKLEKELGGPLLDRGGRSIRLTDAGRRFYEHASQILATVEEARHDLSETAGVGQVNVGAIPTIAPYILPGVLKRFHRLFPKAEVTLFENLTEYTIKSCLEGETDLGLLALPVQNDQLYVEPLFTEELLMALPKGHRLSKMRKLALADFAEEPFVLLSEAHCLGEQIVSFCKQQSCLPTVSCHSAQLLTVQEMVGLGHGVSLIPEMAIRGDKSKSRVYRSLSGTKPARTIAMIWKKNRYQSQLVIQLQNLIRKELKSF
jgi:LysR family hydrogen peroxide-inducible transcriptional activator